MIEKKIKYITNQDGKISEVILPITLFEKMVEELEDKELLRLMKQIEKKSVDYLSESESFELIDSLIETSEIQA
jgi:hypothetical protein